MRLIPKLLSEETEMFRYHSCRFKNDICKARAARIVLWKELNIQNCFTFEASFHGYFDHEKVNFEFTPETYEQIGASLVNSLFNYMMILEENERRKKLKDLGKQKHKEIIAEKLNEESPSKQP